MQLPRVMFPLFIFLVATLGCSDNNGSDKSDAGNLPDADPGIVLPDTYQFDSRFIPEATSVSYSGQVFRQVLISDLKTYIDRLTLRIDTTAFVPTTGDVITDLNFYFAFDSASAAVDHTIDTTPGPLQTSYGDISSSKTLAGKVAGNDPVGQHKDWSTGFVGWTQVGVTTPQSLVTTWFGELETLAINRANGLIPAGPDGSPIDRVFVSASGLDYSQLLSTFLAGSIGFSQATDDYLDDDTADKGLLSSNILQDGSSTYSILEHAWDEGFGYFGAARDYANYTDQEAAGLSGRSGWSAGYYDTDATGDINLLAEYNFGFSRYAAARDATSNTPTDFTKDIWDAFVRGRAIIAFANGALDDTQLQELTLERDTIASEWEKVVAATVVHHINKVLNSMNSFGTTQYSFFDHASNWSQMKGLAMSFQFNPRSPLTDSQFSQLHTLLGQAPVLPTANGESIGEYKVALSQVKDTLQSTYDFSADNMGDVEGNNGW